MESYIQFVKFKEDVLFCSTWLDALNELPSATTEQIFPDDRDIYLITDSATTAPIGYTFHSVRDGLFYQTSTGSGLDFGFITKDI